jgi:hypothetical protein
MMAAGEVGLRLRSALGSCASNLLFWLVEQGARSKLTEAARQSPSSKGNRPRRATLKPMLISVKVLEGD